MTQEDKIHLIKMANDASRDSYPDWVQTNIALAETIKNKDNN